MTVKVPQWSIVMVATEPEKPEWTRVMKDKPRKKWFFRCPPLFPLQDLDPVEPENMSENLLRHLLAWSTIGYECRSNGLIQALDVSEELEKEIRFLPRCALVEGMRVEKFSWKDQDREENLTEIVFDGDRRVFLRMVLGVGGDTIKVKTYA